MMSDYPAGTVLGAWPVDLGTLELDRVDSDKVEWSVTKMTGWGSAATSGETTDRTRANGAWAPRWFRRAKEYSIFLSVDADTPAARWAAEQRLQGAIGTDDTLMIMREETPRQTTVRVNGDLTIDRTSVYTFDAEIPLLALDPLRYGITENIRTIARNGANTVPNDGNTTSWPLIRINGPLTNPKIALNANTFMRIDAVIPDGSWLVIDTDNRQVRMFDDPDSSLRRFFAGNWFGIPPEGAVLALTSTSGTGNAVITNRDTWN